MGEEVDPYMSFRFVYGFLSDYRPIATTGLGRTRFAGFSRGIFQTAVVSQERTAS